MTPTPPNTTIRYKVHYSGPFNEHTMLFHGLTGIDPIVLRTSVQNVVIAMSGAQWNTTTWHTAEVALAGSDIFNVDVGWTDVTRSSATNPAADDAPSHFAQFGGRSPTTGKRAKWYLFEDTMGDTADMRFSGGENADVAAIVAAFVAESDVIGAIDGTDLVFYNYANVGQNDHLTHKARS